MSEIEIRSLNGHKLVDETAREMIANSTAQPDWNAKEGEQGYIKNRTHWEEISYQTVFDCEGHDQGALCEFYFTEPIKATPGNMYTVTWNGDTYTLPCYEIGREYKVEDCYCFGNPEFLLMDNPAGWGLSIFLNKRATSWDSSLYLGELYQENKKEITDTRLIIEGEVSTIKELDNKFIPLKNIVQGSSEGSIRTSSSWVENSNYVLGEAAFAEGYETQASGRSAHSEGDGSIASGRAAHAEGRKTEATGYASHAEGYYSHAEGDYGHAEGAHNRAEGEASHAEGNHNYAEGVASHAEGNYSHAYGDYSHAEGDYNYAEGYASHAEGGGKCFSLLLSGNANATTYTNNTSIPSDAHVGMTVRMTHKGTETGITYSSAKITAIDTTTNTITVNNTLSDTAVAGAYTIGYYSGMAIGNFSHKEGYQCIALGNSQHVQGQFNVVDPYAEYIQPSYRGKYADIIGNGISYEDRSNAYALDWDGNAYHAGDVYVNGDGKNDFTGMKKLATEEYVAEEIANIGNTLAFHPIGSIYMSVNETSPAELFGGTWEQLKNRFLLGTSDAHPLGETGGSETHTLTQAELPQLTGTAQFGGGAVGATEGGYGAVRTASGIFSGVNVMQYGRPTEATTGRYAQNTTSFRDLKIQFGSGKAHNNMPPYIAVNIWKRVA